MGILHTLSLHRHDTNFANLIQQISCQYLVLFLFITVSECNQGFDL